MVVPDFELICEIMLVAEGFLDARLLARKFITLYQLCKELLSKQDHYDWGLRAIKSVLVVAGSLKRADRVMSEDSVLMRALRDFNTPKIVTDDTPVFLGLIGDLFPQLNAPRQRNPKFETDVRSATEQLGLQPEDSFVLKVFRFFLNNKPVFEYRLYNYKNYSMSDIQYLSWEMLVLEKVKSGNLCITHINCRR